MSLIALCFASQNVFREAPRSLRPTFLNGNRINFRDYGFCSRVWPLDIPAPPPHPPAASQLLILQFPWQTAAFPLGTYLKHNQFIYTWHAIIFHNLNPGCNLQPHWGFLLFSHTALFLLKPGVLTWQHSTMTGYHLKNVDTGSWTILFSVSIFNDKMNLIKRMLLRFLGLYAPTR